MARKHKKQRTSRWSTPIIKLSTALLDEIDELASTRHPEEEAREIKLLERAFKLVDQAQQILGQIDY